MTKTMHAQRRSTGRAWMIWTILVALGGLLLLSAGCCSSGSREFIPGKGWVPND